MEGESGFRTGDQVYNILSHKIKRRDESYGMRHMFCVYELGSYMV
jgi:hypothetical protein